MDSPLFSVVVVIASDTIDPADTRHLDACLASLMQQSNADSMEAIVSFPSNVAGMEALRRRYPRVRFLVSGDLRNYSPLGRSREHHGELIARGFAAAGGDVVALLEDNDVAAPDWSTRMMEAHNSSYAAVGGAIENGIDRNLNWAVYIDDFQFYQRPLPKGESQRVSDANVSYKRIALESIRPVWEKEYHEAQISSALLGRGEKMTLAPEAVVYQHRQDLRLLTALRERFVWGRSFGGWRCGRLSWGRRALLIAASPALPLLLIFRRTRTAFAKRRHLNQFLRALPLTTLLTVTWCCGELTGYLTGRAVSRRIASRARLPVAERQAVS